MSQLPLSPPYDILVVDDSSAIRALVSSSFAPLSDYRVRTAASAEEGRAQIRLKLPDILLLDCQLDAGASGVDVLAASPVASAPITIVFSASADDANTLYDRWEQVVSRMLKPFHPSELVTHVKESIARNQEALEFVRRVATEAEPPLSPPPEAALAPQPPVVTLEDPDLHIAPPPLAGGEEAELFDGAGGDFGEEEAGGEAPQPAPRGVGPAGSLPHLTPASLFPALPLGGEEAAEETDHPLASAILTHPAVLRALNRALRSVYPDAEPPLACGESAVLHPATLIGWAKRRRQVVRLRSRCATEVCDVWFSGGRLIGVATDLGGRRGHPAPGRPDVDGQQQEDALERILMMPPGQYLEARAFGSPPAWTMMQSPAALERLGRFIGT